MNETKARDREGHGDELRHLREITKNAEHEMNEAVLSCTRARRQFASRDTHAETDAALNPYAPNAGLSNVSASGFRLKRCIARLRVVV